MKHMKVKKPIFKCDIQYERKRAIAWGVKKEIFLLRNVDNILAPHFIFANCLLMLADAKIKLKSENENNFFSLTTCKEGGDGKFNSEIS